jgi:hypothetical protein
MAERTPRTIAEQGGGGSVPNNPPDIGPEQDCEAEQGGAPGGNWPSEQELPVRPVAAPPARTGGFRPSPQTHPLPEPGSSEGEPKT